MADSDLQNRANQAQIDLLNKLDRNSDVGVGFYVGFKDTVLTQLKDILKNINKETTIQLNKGLSEINTSLEKGQKEQEEQSKKLQDSLSSKNGKLGKAIDAMAEASSISQSTALKLQKAARVLSVAADGLIAGVSIAKKATMETATLASDLRESGLVLSDGRKQFKDTLLETSNDLGMARNDVVKILKGSSEQISRYGASTGKNLDNIIKDTMTTYRDNNDITTSNVESIMKLQMDAITHSLTTEELARYNLQQGTANLTKNFRELSIATGKSVDMLVKEQQQKNQNLLVQHFRETNITAASRLDSMGIKDQDMLEFITTGRVTAGLAAKMQDPAMRDLIQTLRGWTLSGRLNKEDNLQEVMAVFNPKLAAARSAAVERANYYQNQGNIMNAGEAFLAQFAGLNLTAQLNAKMLEQRNQSEEDAYITEQKRMNMLANTVDNVIASAQSLSSDGFKTLNDVMSLEVEAIKRVTNALSGMEDKIKNYTGYNPSGMLTSFVQGLTSQIGDIATTVIALKLTGDVGKIGGTITNLFGNLFKKKTASNLQKVFEAGKNVPKTTAGIGGGLMKWGGRLFRGATAASYIKDAYDSFNSGDKIQGSIDSLKALSQVSSLGFFAEGAEKAGKGIGNWIADAFISKDIEKIEKSKRESAERVNMFKMLMRETQLTPDIISDMLDKGLSPDKIIEQNNRIKTGVEEIKQDSSTEQENLVTHQKINMPEQQKELNIREEIPQMSLSKDTIDALSVAFANSLAQNTYALQQFANAINQTYQEISKNSRMDSVLALGQGFNSSTYSQS